MNRNPRRKILISVMRRAEKTHIARRDPLLDDSSMFNHSDDRMPVPDRLSQASRTAYRETIR